MNKLIRGLEAKSNVLLIGLSLCVIGLGVVASKGLFSLDEVIYLMGVEAFRQTGGFVVSNGYDSLQLEPLRLWFLVPGPFGLVTQYPVGSAIVGGLVSPVFAQKSLIVMNVLAGVGTLFTTHALCRRLFQSDYVANVSVILLIAATYWLEYVVGHWPHSVSVFATTLALLLAVIALDRESRAWLPALGSGLVIGAGMFFRLDGILILPPLVVITIFFARQVFPVLIGGVAGLAPSVVLLGAVNSIKFGTWNPLSYGSSGGGTDLTNYIPLLGLMVLGLAAMLGTRFSNIRLPQFKTSYAAFGIAVLGLVAAALVPPLWKALVGAYGLLVDARVLPDERSGVVDGPGGTVLFWGLAKKALGQSMPWLGCLVLLLNPTWWDRKRGIQIVLIFGALWIAPFAMRSWHGGYGMNMRYFLPVLPALCGLSAYLLVNMATRLDSWLQMFFRAGAVGILIGPGWMQIAPAGEEQIQQVLSFYGLAAVIAVSAFAAFRRTDTALRFCQAVTYVAIGFSVYLSLADFSKAQVWRIAKAKNSDIAAQIEGRVIFLGAAEAAASAIGQEDHLLAMPDRITLDWDLGVFAPACATGYQVLTTIYLDQGDLCLTDIPAASR